MALAGYFRGAPDLSILARRWDRLLYGSDFPNVPYAWSRELAALREAKLTRDQARAILSGNARRLFARA